MDLSNRREAEQRYEQWISSMTSDVRPAYAAMMVAATNWHDEIFAYFDHRVTNAYTESLNSVIKLTNRIGRGYSFDVIRALMLYGEKPPATGMLFDHTGTIQLSPQFNWGRMPSRKVKFSTILKRLQGHDFLCQSTETSE